MNELRQNVFEANLRLVSEGLVIGTWGNASGIDRQAGIVIIKPSGVPYDCMRPEDLVSVSLDGEVIEGNLRPSSDLPTHLAIYRGFPDVGGVAHTHSACATAYAQARVSLPCLGTTHADHFYGNVPVTRALREDEVATDYELNTGNVIVETFQGKNENRIPAVLVAQHGPFTWGSDVEAAVTNSVVLEAVAKMGIMTVSLNPDVCGIDSYLLDKHFLRKHGSNAYYGQQ